MGYSLSVYIETKLVGVPDLTLSVKVYLLIRIIIILIISNYYKLFCIYVNRVQDQSFGRISVARDVFHGL